MSDLYPLRIQPCYEERIWGGDALATLLGKPGVPRDKPIGESWEIYEENRVINGTHEGKTIGQLRGLLGRDLTGHVAPNELFPLLTKLIDARDVLSVQVHPDDRFARDVEHQPYGKTECWYVIKAEPGATLTYGFSRDSNPDEYTKLVQEGQLEKILRPLPVDAGDVVYIPAGTVHAIGAGIVLYELQQTSDITYRIYDWNRRDANGKSRELHVEKAKQVLDYHRATRGKIYPLQANGRAMLIAGQYFCMELIETDRAGTLSTYNSAVAICTLNQAVSIRTADDSNLETLNRYSSALLPAACQAYTLHATEGEGSARALVAYVPESQEATRSDLLARGFNAAEVDSFLAQFAPASDLGKPAS